MLAPKNERERELHNNVGFLRSQYEPYQQKIWYDVEKDLVVQSPSSDDEVNEDALQAEEQPYVTTASIAYKELLKQVATGELAKRSDIMITSTLSISMFPKDKRLIQARKRAEFQTDDKKLQEYVDEKNAFTALVKELQYRNRTVRDKEKEYTDAYMKSFIQKKHFKTGTLQRFKEAVRILNSNVKPVKKVDKAVLKAEKLKHE